MPNLVQWIVAADQILVDMPGCEWPMAQLKLIESALEYFEDSQAWVEECAPLVTAAGVADYDVLDLRDTVVSALGAVFVAGQEMTAITPARFKALRQRDPTRGFPRYATWMQGLLWLHSAPVISNDPIVASLVLKPGKGATGLPSELWDVHGEAIIEGAKYRLYNSQGKPYSNPGAASTSFQLYRSAIDTAAIVAEQGGTAAVARTTPDYF